MAGLATSGLALDSLILFGIPSNDRLIELR